MAAAPVSATLAENIQVYMQDLSEGLRQKIKELSVNDMCLHIFYKRQPPLEKTLFLQEIAHIIGNIRERIDLGHVSAAVIAREDIMRPYPILKEAFAKKPSGVLILVFPVDECDLRRLHVLPTLFYDKDMVQKVDMKQIAVNILSSIRFWPEDMKEKVKSMLGDDKGLVLTFNCLSKDDNLLYILPFIRSALYDGPNDIVEAVTIKYEQLLANKMVDQELIDMKRTMNRDIFILILHGLEISYRQPFAIRL